MLALALLLLPGLLVVRAPWTAVPALSLAFWAVSAIWLPSRFSRSGFVSGALVAFGLLFLLRLLPKHEVPPPPGVEAPPGPEPASRPGLPPPPLRTPASLLVLSAALVLLAPAPLWTHAPGPALAFQTTAARLVQWRDGLPLSAEPLLPLTPFAAHAPALSLLAADVSAQVGLDVAPALVLVLAAAAALAVTGLFSAMAVALRPLPAASSAVLALALVPSPGWLAPFDAGPALLALSFLLPAGALLVGHRSRSSGCAAAVLAAAGLLSQPLLTTLAFAVAVVGAGRLRPPARRAAAVAAGALALAAPFLLRSLPAVSGGEWPRLVSWPSASEWLALATALASLRLVPVVLGRGWPAHAARRRGFALLALGSLAVVLLGLRFHLWMADGQLPPAERRWLARAAAAGRPLDRICAPDRLAPWVPALAGRAVAPLPPVPGVYRDELLAHIPRPCRDLPASGQ